MRFFAALALVVVAVASEADQTHYEALNNIVAPIEDAITSVSLSELKVHIGIKNPMKTIYETCVKMRREIYADRTAAIKRELSDRKLCTTTINRYASFVSEKRKAAARQKNAASSRFRAHKRLEKIPDSLNKTRYNRNVTIASQEVTVKRGQATRDGQHGEFLKLVQAFEWALNNLTAIHRALNGEGTLGDLHGAEGFLEHRSCSSAMQQIATATADVPVVSSMLQVFSKAFAKVESNTDPVAKTALGTTANTQKSTGDMDAINTILAKVRENLVGSLKLATDQENKMISLWKSSKRSQRSKINTNWISNGKDFKKQGQVEREIGEHWEAEGKHLVKEAQEQKRQHETAILKEFLGARCRKSRRDFSFDMAAKGNELNALGRVIRYLRVNVFPKWSKNINDVASSPYVWKVDPKPVYVDVGKDTFSTTANPGDDSTTCARSYSTVFTKIRILTLNTTGAKFVDPNDLTHSKNFDVRRRTQLKGSTVQCQLFPTGIPLGRAHSCSKHAFSYAKVDLTGSGYKFGKSAKRMFKALGRKTHGSYAKLSSNGLVLSLRVRGRCGDIYGDDAPAENADYRSDPIPVETYGIAKK